MEFSLEYLLPDGLYLLCARTGLAPDGDEVF